MSEFIVHTVPGSPFARAVMATLEEKGAPWRLSALTPGAHRAEPHMSRNPFGRMPAVEHGDFTIYETAAILRYLDRVLREPPLTPDDPKAAARMDQVMSINDWYLFQGVGNVIGFQRVVGPMLMGLTPDVAAIEAVMPKAQTVFAVLGGILGDQSYFAGKSVSLADLMVAPQVDMLAQTPEWTALTAERPNLVAWLGRMNARPSLAATTMSKVAALAATS